MEISIRSIDVGFDIRNIGQAVVLMPTVTKVLYETIGDGKPMVAEGNYDSIVKELAAVGYDLIVDETPNGRVILYNRHTGKYEVQPHNDNYVLSCDSLEQAHNAYYHPELY